jgi:hypothetical protein
MDFSLLFAGIVISFIVQTVKEYCKFDVRQTGLFVIAISIVIGVLWAVLKEKGLLDGVLQVYIYSGAVYAFITKNLEKALD